LLEVALALPVTVFVFAGLADLTMLFAQQTRMEDLARSSARLVITQRDRLIQADARSLAELAAEQQRKWASDPSLSGITVAMKVQYACPEPLEQASWQDAPSGCGGERVFIRIEQRLPVGPILHSLKAIHYPSQVTGRLYVRLR
jgi:hypothetical protein